MNDDKRLRVLQLAVVVLGALTLTFAVVAALALYEARQRDESWNTDTFGAVVRALYESDHPRPPSGEAAEEWDANYSAHRRTAEATYRSIMSR